MFPTIGHLFSYLTGVSLHLPVPTFGFFMMLSFAGAWWVFRSEYKRKEAEGLIYPFTEVYPFTEGLIHPFTEAIRKTRTFSKVPKEFGGRLAALAGWGLTGFSA